MKLKTNSIKTIGSYINRRAQVGSLDVVTVDVFDTFLLRKIHPEDAQFSFVARRWSVRILEKFKSHIDPYYLLQLRYEARERLIRVAQISHREPEAAFDDILQHICVRLVDQLMPVAEREERSVHKSKDHLVQELKFLLREQELQEEIKRLESNQNLLDILLTFKQHGGRVYFLSDMYLSAQDILHILRAHKLEHVFDGGFTSSDLGVGKWSGGAYKLLIQGTLIPDYFPDRSLHIGDNEISDFQKPMTYGIMSIWYDNSKQTRHIKLQDYYHRLRFHVLGFMRDRTDRKFLKHALFSSQYTSLPYQEQILANVGKKLAIGLHYYLFELIQTAALTNKQVIFVSREGQRLSELCRIIDPGFKFELCSINRALALQLLIKAVHETNSYNAVAVDQLCELGELKKTSLENTLIFLFGIDSRIKPKPSLQQAPDTVRSFINNYRQALVPRFLELQALEDWLMLTLAKNRNVLWADLGWNGTIQMLLEKLMEIRGVNINSSGLYMGTTGVQALGRSFSDKNIFGILFSNHTSSEGRALLVEEIWEYFLTFRSNNVGSTYFQKNVIEGVSTYFHAMRKLMACHTPRFVYRSLYSELFNLFVEPSQLEVYLLKDIPHDLEIGFRSKKQIPIIDSTISRKRLYATLVLKPRSFLRILRNQYWQGGFMAYYGLNTLIRLREMFKKLLVFNV
ncbi:MAG TPA: hypothetical protein PKG71_03480 [Candidatus Woesebacteria bacterium]|nr:hypothetical protein [Candidatus Woesebacteria bacterium]HNS95004.1 hypothetical protein [Candidatus Woesebacteria bacterium]